jgi:hypothetical protein
MSTTVHVVQSFTVAKGALTPDPQRTFKSADEAVSAAKRLAMKKDGVLAFTAAVNARTGHADETTILFLAGQLPTH